MSARSAASRPTRASIACAPSSRCRTAARSRASFCVIPLVRGSSRSRAADAVLGEIRRRVAQGHREIVLTGINLGCYRDRAAGYDLPRLVREAGETPGLRAAAALLDRDQPRQRRAHRRAARDADRRAPSPRAAPVGGRRRACATWDGATPSRRTSVASSRCAASSISRATSSSASRPRTSARSSRRCAPSPTPGSRRCTCSRTRRGPARSRPPTTRCRPQAKKERGARLRAASHDACLAHWRSKLGAEDAVLVDRPGRGYGDDYSPWLVPEDGARRRAGPRPRRRASPTRECSPRERRLPLLPALPRGRSRRGDRRLRRDPRHQPAGAGAPPRASPSGTSTRSATSASSRADEAKRMLEFVADVAAREGLTDYRVAVNVGPSAGQTVFHLHWHVMGGWA